jgi:PadR family transcriptional regulator, regulatory protein AphA
MSGVKQPFTVELGLLGFLRQQPMHPYELHQRLLQSEALGTVWHVKQAHLYAVLRRFEEAGYLESVTEPQGLRPPRKVLSLTAEGESTFQRWLSTPVAHGRDFRLEFLAKLFFAHAEGVSGVQALVGQQRHACEERLARFDTQLASIGSAQPYERLVLEFRRGQLAATLAWLDRCVDLLVPTPA